MGQICFRKNAPCKGKGVALLCYLFHPMVAKRRPSDWSLMGKRPPLPSVLEWECRIRRGSRRLQAGEHHTPFCTNRSPGAAHHPQILRRTFESINLQGPSIRRDLRCGISESSFVSSMAEPTIFRGRRGQKLRSGDTDVQHSAASVPGRYIPKRAAPTLELYYVHLERRTWMT